MLIDSTLREGEQHFGVYLSTKDKQEVLQGLYTIGVDEIELGVAGRDSYVSDVLRFARSLGPGPALSIWSPCRTKDLDRAREIGPDRLSIGVPVSDLHLGKRLRTTREAILVQVRDVLSKAKDMGFPYVSLGLEDASRADEDFVLEVAHLAEECGAQRVRLSDTIGILDPLATAKLVSRFKAELSISVALHCHNDFGMASANAITALDAGADFVDASILGLGERAGIARLEEVVAFLHLRRGVTKYNVTPLAALCRLTADSAGTEIQPYKAVVGSGLFRCESGLHTHGLYKEPSLYEPFPPELFGQRRRISIGKKSGRGAVTRKLRELSIDLPPGTDIEKIISRLRWCSEKLGRPLGDGEVYEEVEEMLRKYSSTLTLNGPPRSC